MASFSLDVFSEYVTMDESTRTRKAGGARLTHLHPIARINPNAFYYDLDDYSRPAGALLINHFINQDAPLPRHFLLLCRIFAASSHFPLPSNNQEHHNTLYLARRRDQ